MPRHQPLQLGCGPLPLDGDDEAEEPPISAQIDDLTDDDTGFHQRLLRAEHQFRQSLQEIGRRESSMNTSMIYGNRDCNHRGTGTGEINQPQRQQMQLPCEGGSFWRSDSSSNHNINYEPESAESSFSSMRMKSPTFDNGHLVQLHSEYVLTPATGAVDAPALLSSSGGAATVTSRNSSYVMIETHSPRRQSWRLMGKSSSLIFPSGIPALLPGSDSESISVKHRKINNMLDHCERIRFLFKRKLLLEHMNLTADDIPVQDLDGTSLGLTLSKLSLADNRRLGTIPTQLVQCLPVLEQLDLSFCDLYRLPNRWDLPRLKRLNLSHNQLTEFPNEIMLTGLPALIELNMFGNNIVEMILPHNHSVVLSKLEILNLGGNDLTYLPDELEQLTSLRALKLSNNLIETIPRLVCYMALRQLDVSSNPVIQPPMETCDRGIRCMKRYYHGLRQEEECKQTSVRSNVAHLWNGLKTRVAPMDVSPTPLLDNHNKSSNAASLMSPPSCKKETATTHKGEPTAKCALAAGLTRIVVSLWVGLIIALVLYFATERVSTKHCNWRNISNCKSEPSSFYLGNNWNLPRSPTLNAHSKHLDPLQPKPHH